MRAQVNIIKSEKTVFVGCERGLSGNLTSKTRINQLTQNQIIRSFYPEIYSSFRRGEWKNCLENIDKLLNQIRDNGRGLSKALSGVEGLNESLFLCLKWIHNEILSSGKFDNDRLNKVMANIKLLATHNKGILSEYIDLCLDLCDHAPTLKDGYLNELLELRNDFSIDQRSRLATLLEVAAKDILLNGKVQKAPDPYAALFDLLGPIELGFASIGLYRAIINGVENIYAGGERKFALDLCCELRSCIERKLIEDAVDSLHSSAREALKETILRIFGGPKEITEFFSSNDPARKGFEKKAFYEYRDMAFALVFGPKGERWVKAAEEFLLSGEFDPAHEIYDELLRTDEGNVEYLIRWGDILWAQGALSLARDHFLDVLQYLSEVHGGSFNESPEARRITSRLSALENYPSTDGKSELNDVFPRRDILKKHGILQAAAKIYPHRMRLGDILWAEGKFPEAEAIFQGDIKELEKVFVTDFKKNPILQKLHERAIAVKKCVSADLNFSQGKYIEAKASFEKVMESYPFVSVIRTQLNEIASGAAAQEESRESKKLVKRLFKGKGLDIDHIKKLFNSKLFDRPAILGFIEDRLHAYFESRDENGIIRLLNDISKVDVELFNFDPQSASKIYLQCLIKISVFDRPGNKNFLDLADMVARSFVGRMFKILLASDKYEDAVLSGIESVFLGLILYEEELLKSYFDGRSKASTPLDIEGYIQGKGISLVFSIFGELESAYCDLASGKEKRRIARWVPNKFLRMFGELILNNMTKAPKIFRARQFMAICADYLADKELDVAYQIMKFYLALKSMPEFWREASIYAFYNMTVTCSYLERHDEAIKYANELLDSAPPAQLALLGGRTIDPIFEAKNIIGVSMLAKGKGYLKAKDPAKLKPLKSAEKIFTELLSSSPENISILNNLAVAYFRMGKYSDAMRLYERVLSIEGDNIYANRNMIDVMIASGKDADALSAIMDLIGRNDNVREDPWVYAFLVALAEKKGIDFVANVLSRLLPGYSDVLREGIEEFEEEEGRNAPDDIKSLVGQ